MSFQLIAHHRLITLSVTKPVTFNVSCRLYSAPITADSLFIKIVVDPKPLSFT
jgi:hypothetical protein